MTPSNEDTVTIPDHVNARWCASLGNDQLIAAEAKLHADFRTQEKAEKTRTGGRYVLLQGPPELVSAWHRWLLVSNETRARGLTVRHAR
jgi:hypothetical protein